MCCAVASWESWTPRGRSPSVYAARWKLYLLVATCWCVSFFFFSLNLFAGLEQAYYFSVVTASAFPPPPRHFFSGGALLFLCGARKGRRETIFSSTVELWGIGRAGGNLLG